MAMALRRRLAGGWFGLALVCAATASPADETPAPAPAPVLTPAAAPAPAADPAPAAALAPTAIPLPAPISAPAGVPAAAALPGEAAPPATPAATPSSAPVPVIAAPAKPKKVAPPPPPLETALSNDPTPTLSPDTAALTAKAADRYAAIDAMGGWPTDVAPLNSHSKGPEVADLRRRLAMEGDLDRPAADGLEALAWDADLTAAVKRFQARMGLRQTGIVAGATVKVLNVPASVRALELAASARRLADLTFPFGERYVVVNLPSTSVEAVENGAVVHRYAAIVGDVDHPSPQIAAHVAAINLNPTWTVPVSIIKKEIIPRMQRDPGYLAREKIRILDGSGAEVDPKRIDWSTQRAANYTLRQDSGAGNSLGAIRIDMPNKLAVYMHDTPSKRLFGADYRFLSHGCVRVQGVYDLAAWLLDGTSGGPAGAWDKDSLLAETKSGAREDIRLTRATPVIWVYLTGWASADGAVHFRNDVYGLDAAADASASAAPAAPLAQGQPFAPFAANAQ
jgi:murein L,D-transpeptidase YcbB/YkuD